MLSKVRLTVITINRCLHVSTDLGNGQRSEAYHAGRDVAALGQTNIASGEEADCKRGTGLVIMHALAACR